MKKIWSIFCFIIMLSCFLSVPAYAYNTISPSSYNFLIPTDNGYRLNVSISTSSLKTEQQIAEWRDFINALKGKGSGTPLIFVRHTTKSPKSYDIFFYLSKGGYSFQYVNGFYRFVPDGVTGLYFNLSFSSNSTAGLLHAYSSPKIEISDGTSGGAGARGVILLGGSSLTGLPAAANVANISNLFIQDDLPPLNDLTIQYQYEDGREAAPLYRGAYEQGADFSVSSPAISGYIPSIATISGVMGDADLAYTVTYKQIKHTLTIQYQYEDGVQAHEPYTAQLAEGESFRVDVPVIDGYKPSINVFTGQMANIDLNYTVTYTKIKEPEPSSSSGESSGSSGGSSSGSGGDSSGGGGGSSGGSSSGGGGSSGDASIIENPYIVWNPTLVSAGFKQMKQQAGTAFNAGIWVFLMITGIILLVKLLRDLAH